MRWLLVVAVLTLAACSEPMPIQAFRDTRPAIDPVRFFTGHVRSWGVMENRSGQPTSIVTTDCRGEADGPDGLRMTQTLQVGAEPPVTRLWRMRRTASGQFEASANDSVGAAVGDASGNAFHWQWSLALQPGNALKNVTMDQWWYLLEDGSMLNRTTIRKLGIIVAEVTERFARAE